MNTNRLHFIINIFFLRWQLPCRPCKGTFTGVGMRCKSSGIPCSEMIACLVSFQWKTLLEEKSRIVEFGQSQPWSPLIYFNNTAQDISFTLIKILRIILNPMSRVKALEVDGLNILVYQGPKMSMSNKCLPFWWDQSLLEQCGGNQDPWQAWHFEK